MSEGPGLDNRDEALTVVVERLQGAEDLPLPRYMSAGASGMDLAACVAEPVRLKPGERQLIPTGIRVAIPPGYEGQVRPRSGLAIRQGLTLLNAPGTIDSDYRGEVKVVLINLGNEEVEIRRGDRIAQLVFARVQWAQLQEGRVEETPRGGGGFGHTGV